MNPLDEIGSALTAAQLERDDFLGAIDAAAVALAAVTAERDDLRDRLEEEEGGPGCLYGSTVPTSGFADLQAFVAATFPPEVVRCYPGGANSLSQVKKAAVAYPAAAIVYNLHVASKNLTQPQIDTLVKAIEVEAAKVPRFVLCPDAEPDRQDRTYNTASFLAAFERVVLSVAQHAPHVEVSLNLTGYDFAARIGAYDRILPHYETLSLDPYWLPTTGTVQGSERDLAAADAWCGQHGKGLALAEWGAKGGDYNLLSDALVWIRQHDVEFSCYFNETLGSANIGSTKITTPEAFAVYRAGAS